MSKTKIQSVEPRIAELGNGWLKNYGLDYKLEQESLNHEIDNALAEYFSKSGGTGGNRPDAKILIEFNSRRYPVLIEYKGYKDKLIKLDSEDKVENKKSGNEPNYQNIKNFAVNGAVHYANAILHYTNYTDIIAIGMTGYKDEKNILQHKIAVYFVSTKNLGIGQEVGEYTDFSFLKKENFPQFIDNINKLALTEQEFQKLKTIRELEVDASLVKLNNDIFKNEKGISEQERLHLVVATIMATLGKNPLEKKDLISSDEITDGEILMRKVEDFLSERKLPDNKRQVIIRTLKNTVTSTNINKIENGETQLKRVFSKIFDDLGIYYKIGLTTDFTGKLFNEMYNWLGFANNKNTANNVVLTPPYVAKLLVKLARTNRDSYVLDNAAGSAGLLVAAMNEMIADARENIKSPAELLKKEISIRTKQILGIEILQEVYMLAVLNMILMGDGSSKILNLDSLKDFDGNFPADVFVLNPPYTNVEGKGMIFVETALKKMTHGYAAIIIQNSAGTGQAIENNKRILERNTLLASIKMPTDLFIGRSSVQTNIYVFRVGEPHNSKNIVKFIDFSNDGYKRTDRKKSKINHQDIDHAAERYEELVNLVHFGRNYLKFFTENEYYEGTIDPTSGKDWNQTAPIDTRPTLDDFKKTVSDYLAFEVTNILKNNSGNCLGKNFAPLAENLNNVEWGAFLLKNLFEIKSYKKRFDANKIKLTESGHPYIVRQADNNGQKGFIDEDSKFLNEGNTISFGQDTATIFYQEKPYFTGDKIKILHSKNSRFKKENALFFISAMNKAFSNFAWGSSNFDVETLKSQKIFLPTKAGEIDFEFMEKFIAELEAERIAELEAYLLAAGLKNTNLTAEEEFALENLNTRRFEKFLLKDLFGESTRGKRLKSDDRIEGNLPFVTAGESDEGISDYIANEVKIFSKNTITIDMFGSAKYRNYDYGADDHIAVVHTEKIPKLAAVFVTAAIHKVSHNGQFHYGRNFYPKDADSLEILLPTKDGEPDYEFMEKFISAVQKTVIADVVRYSEEKISAYRQVTNK